MQILSYKIKFKKRLFHPLHIQPVCIMRMIIFNTRHLFIALHEKLDIIQVARITRDAIIIAHIFRLSHFLTGDKRFVQFLAMACANHLNFRWL